MKARKRMLLGFLFMITTIAFLLMLAGETSGRTLIVAQDGSGDHEFIQEAIGQAQDGDVIRVYEGAYFEEIFVDRSVSLIGNGSGVTVINGSQDGNVVIVTANITTISGFTIEGSSQVGFQNAGLRIESNHNVIQNNSFTGNRNGIALSDSTNTTIIGNVISNNTHYGIYINFGQSTRIEENLCEFNGDAGILLESSENDTVRHNTIRDNNAQGIFSVQVLNSVIEDNSITGNMGEGIWAIEGENMVINDNVISGNELDGIDLQGWETEITDNTIMENHQNGILLRGGHNRLLNNNVLENGGNGITLDGGNDTVISDNTLHENGAAGLELFGSENGIISGNDCARNSNGIVVKESMDNLILNSTCSNNSINGIEILRSENIDIQNSQCEDNGGAGIFLRDTMDSKFENMISRNNMYGLHADNGSQGNRIVNSKIYENMEYGVNAEDNGGFIIEASFNWWGDDSGPYHPTLHLEGAGDTITYFVNFIPWLPPVNVIPVAFIDSIIPNTALEGEIIHFIGTGSDFNGTIVRYSWSSSIDGELYNGTESEFDRTDLSPGNHTIFLKVLDNRGAWSAEFSTSLTILKGEEPEPEGENESSDDEDWGPLLILMLIVVALLVRFSFIPLAREHHE